MTTKWFFARVLLAGLLLAGSGAALRANAAVQVSMTERRLLAARPAGPAAISVSPVTLPPSDGIPSLIRLPAHDLWNVLEPVTPRPQVQDGELSLAWNVRDGGWHRPAQPGFGLNVVVAGHSPSLDPTVWSRSIFRQLAYLNPGDQVELTAGSRIYVYAVARVFAIPAAEADSPSAGMWIAPGEQERLTLVTCWPPNTAAYRVIAIADPISYKERENHETH